MSSKKSFPYLFMAFSLLVVMSFAALRFIFLGAYAIKPYNPVINLGPFGLGFNDYTKGIPMEAYAIDDTIPAAGFHMSGPIKKADTVLAITTTQLNPSGNDLVGEKHAVTALDSAMLGPNFQLEQSIKSACVDKVILNTKPELVSRRLFLMFPKLLLWLVVVFSGWKALKVLQNLDVDDPFREENVKHLKSIAFAIIGLQVCFFVWGELQPYRYVVTVLHPYYNATRTMQVVVAKPFEMVWIWAACCLWALAKVFQRGTETKKENEEFA